MSDQTSTPKRGPGNPRWKPGQSGNPGGRPKGLARRFQELLNIDEIFEFGISIVRDPKQKTADRQAAANMLLDRAWGRAHQSTSIEATVGPQRPQRIDLEAMDKARREALFAQLSALPLLPAGEGEDS